MMFWAYNGSQNASYYAGEVKESSKTLPIANLGSLFVAMVVFMIGGFVWPYVEGYKFLASTGYLFQFHLNEWGMLPTEVSFVLFPNLIWTIILFVALLGWAFTLIFMALFTSARCMFAWAFDRVVPDRISYVHPKWRTPVVAAAVGTVVAWIGLLFSLSPWALWMVSMNYNFILITMMCIIASAGILFPFRQKQIFDMAPRWVRFKIGRIPFMSIWSLVTFGISAGMLYTTVTIPAVGGYIALGTFLLTAGLFITGGIIYAVSRWYRLKKEGVDILMASKELPPV
jgi:amino acid transporter